MPTFFVICLLSFATGLTASGVIKTVVPAHRLVSIFPVLDGLDIRLLRGLGGVEAICGSLVAALAVGLLKTGGAVALGAGLVICIGAVAFHLRRKDPKGAVGAIVLLAFGTAGASGLVSTLL